MRCAAHTLNLVATSDADNALKDKSFKSSFVTTFNKCRTLWNKQNQSVLAAEKIHEKFGKKFVTPNQTRWNSQYDSVVCLIEIIEKCKDLKEFNTNISDPYIKGTKFTSTDVTFLNQYKTVMLPVAEGLDKLQSEKDAYQGLYVPVICLIKDDLKEFSESDQLTLVKPLVMALIDGMNRRFEAALDNQDYLLAAAFHPIFRLEWMEKLLPSKVESTKKTMKNLVFTELKKIGASVQEPEGEEEQVRHEEDSAPKPKSPAKKSWLSKIKNKGVQESGSDAALKKKAISIVDAWLTGFTEEGTKFTDSVFMGEQVLVNLFIKYNTGIPSSAGVERMFSIGKLILRDNRSRLSDENFQRLMLMKGNTNLPR